MLKQSQFQEPEKHRLSSPYQEVQPHQVLVPVLVIRVFVVYLFVLLVDEKYM